MTGYGCPAIPSPVTALLGLGGGGPPAAAGRRVQQPGQRTRHVLDQRRPLTAWTHQHEQNRDDDDPRQETPGVTTHLSLPSCPRARWRGTTAGAAAPPAGTRPPARPRTADPSAMPSGISLRLCCA